MAHKPGMITGALPAYPLGGRAENQRLIDEAFTKLQPPQGGTYELKSSLPQSVASKGRERAAANREYLSELGKGATYDNVDAIYDVVTNPGQAAKAVGDFIRPGLADPMSSPLLIHKSKWEDLGGGILDMFNAATGDQGPRAQGQVLGEVAAGFSPLLSKLKARQPGGEPLDYDDPQITDKMIGDAADAGMVYDLRKPVVDKGTWGQTAYSVENIDPTIEGRQRWNISDRFDGKNTEFQDWYDHDDEMFSRRSAENMPPGDAAGEIARMNSGSGSPGFSGKPAPHSVDTNDYTLDEYTRHTGEPREYPDYQISEEPDLFDQNFSNMHTPTAWNSQTLGNGPVAPSNSYTWYNQTRFREPPEDISGGFYTLDGPDGPEWNPDEPHFPDADPTDLDDDLGESWKF